MFRYSLLQHQNLEKLYFRGDSVQRQKEAMVATLWLDNKVISLLSTNVQPQGSGVTQPRQKDGTRSEVECPDSVLSYSKNMGGVDHANQLRHYYMVRLKCRKSYKYIYNFLLDMSIINAYIIFNQYSDDQKQHIKLSTHPGIAAHRRLHIKKTAREEVTFSPSLKNHPSALA